MLKDRRVLMELEIERLTSKCGQEYLDMLRTNRTDTMPEYDALLSKVITMKAELMIVDKMIADGHE